MEEVEAKRIGGKVAIKAMAIGLVIAQSLMTLLASSDGIMKGFLWFLDDNFFFNVVCAVIISLTVSHCFGRIAGKQILIKNKNEILIGITTGLIVILVSSFLSSWIGFFQEGIDNIGTNDNPFFDYIFKPVYWVSLFGFIPGIIVGIWYGKKIKKYQRNEYPADNTL